MARWTLALVLASLLTGNLWVKEHHELTNQVAAMRSYYGLPPLVEDPYLTDLASEHAWEMATARTLSHSTAAELAQVPKPWTSIGENVGVASEPWLVIRAFMDSPAHREILLGDWSAIGYGHIRGDGKVWVVLWFRR